MRPKVLLNYGMNKFNNSTVQLLLIWTFRISILFISYLLHFPKRNLIFSILVLTFRLQWNISSTAYLATHCLSTVRIKQGTCSSRKGMAANLQKYRKKGFLRESLQKTWDQMWNATGTIISKSWNQKMMMKRKTEQNYSPTLTFIHMPHATLENINHFPSLIRTDSIRLSTNYNVEQNYCLTFLWCTESVEVLNVSKL